MAIRHFLGSIRWRTISALHQRPAILPDAVPTVSFTFDDFPQSALQSGGAILKSYDACGTYYAAMGLMDKVNALGQHFGAEDLKALLRDGHELGSHTFSHSSCRSVPLSDFEADVRKGREAIEAVTGIQKEHQFSYPYGHVTLRGKRRSGCGATSYRGIVPGLNVSPVDLNLLRANSLYSSSLDLDSIGQLLQENGKKRSWLIFYTHDVTESPSAFGCTPTEFEKVVKLTMRSGSRILPVGQVVLGASVQIHTLKRNGW